MPIERGKGVDQPAMRAATDLLARGDWLHVFPESRVVFDGRLGPLRYIYPPRSVSLFGLMHQHCLISYLCVFLRSFDEQVGCGPSIMQRCSAAELQRPLPPRPALLSRGYG